jgi:thiosulfate/3-mercaptopyruvate sulfurtransferase
LLLASALVVSLLVAGPALAAENYKGYVRGESLISVQELKELVDAKDPKLVVIGVAKPVSFKAGHIPGALNVWRPDYEPAEGDPWPFGGMMLNRQDFQDFARGLGIDNDSKVVLYDEKYDATRLWWAFYLYGKPDVRVLDGGYQAWKAAGYDTDMELFGSDVKKGNFIARQQRPGWVAGMYDVWLAKDNPEAIVWDTRSNDEWTGATTKKGAFRPGRIPWAEFLSWKEFKSPVAEGENPTLFKPAAEVEKVVKKHNIDPNKDNIFYCQSAVRTTTPIFALYLMGWDVDRLLNYDGSWIEWSYYDKNPVVVEKAGN